MKLKIKKLDPRAVLPKFQTDGSAGMDLTAIDMAMEIIDSSYVDIAFDISHYKMVYNTGLAFEIPKGHVGLIFPRSSIHKYDVNLTNCVGVIDSDYRGEVKFVFKTLGNKVYEIGDRIGQLVIMKLPEIEVEEVNELSDTERGTGGFGSTGR